MKIKIYGLFILFVILACNACKEQSRTKDKNYVDLVYPLLDSENSRWIFFASACRPFGMVNLSPDNETDGDWGSGYRYGNDTIKAISHIHGWQLSGIPVMPVTFGNRENPDIFSDFKSHFSHESETVKPGYHALFLDRYSVSVELTSTKRVGFHRYGFGENAHPGILFNLNGQLGPCLNKEGILEQSGNRRLTGSVVNAPTRRKPKDLKIFFQADFNADIKSIEKDAGTGNFLITFDLPADRQLLMKVAISYTSADHAALNMSEELAHWDFDKTVTESFDEWNQMLGRIEIEGGTEQQQRRFYTDLWHALLGRRTISDVNGAYPDNTGETFRIGRIPLDNRGKPLFNHYNSDSFWGAQWTLNTLWHLVYPEITEEFVRSMMTMYRDGGLIPRGPAGGNYTYVMTGASSTPFIVSAFQKGIIKDNPEEIYQALKKNHMPGGIMEKAGYEHDTSVGGGLKYYIQMGYVPYPLPDRNNGFHQDGAGMTLEYAYQDWTLAQMAKALGHDDDYEYFMSRSQNYKNLFDPETGWIRPRGIDGQWYAPFDPYEYKHGFVESNSAQSTWFVPHDLPGLAALMGGAEAAREKLEQQFIEAGKLGFTSGNSHAQELHPEYRRIPVNYGNQPSIQTAHVFTLIGYPHLTQYWSRKVVEAAFSGLDPSTGFNGDEDQGLMGSLSVLLKIGLFQMTGGTEENPAYQIGSPLFDQITIHLNNRYYPGNTFIIKTIDNNHVNRSVVHAGFNGTEIKDAHIRHNDLVKGGTLTLQMAEIIK